MQNNLFKKVLKLSTAVLLSAVMMSTSGYSRAMKCAGSDAPDDQPAPKMVKVDTKDVSAEGQESTARGVEGSGESELKMGNLYIYSFVYFKYNNKEYTINIDGQYLLSFSKNFNKLIPYMFDIYFNEDNKNTLMIFNDQTYVIPKNIAYNDEKNILKYFKIEPQVIDKEKFDMINDIIYNLN